MKKKLVAGLLAFALVATAGISAIAATVHYNDSSVTGVSPAWQAWTANWETLANDYTPVSTAPGSSAAVELGRRRRGNPPGDFPRETALGALALYVSGETVA